jgi:thiamine-phosphate pyrophosphorylase
MICLVTDTRRLAAAGASFGARRTCLAAQTRYAVDAGVDLIQLRERDLDAADLAALAGDLRAATHATHTRFVVNDRLDVAIAAGADGVHLRGDSMPITQARQLTPPGFLIGQSVRGADEAGAAASAGADYLVAGTVFPSASKPEQTAWLGIEGLRAIVAAVPIPVLAIGGVSGDRIGDVARAGAAGFAAIELFMSAHGGAELAGCRVVELRQTVKNARAQFGRLN